MIYEMSCSLGTGFGLPMSLVGPASKGRRPRAKIDDGIIQKHSEPLYKADRNHPSSSI